MTKHRDPDLSIETLTYLEAFTRFVLEGKSDGDPEEHERAAKDKAVAFDAMVEEASVTPSKRGQHPRRHFRRAA